MKTFVEAIDAETQTPAKDLSHTIYNSDKKGYALNICLDLLEDILS